MINKRELKRKAKTAFRIVMQNSPMELKRYLTGKKIEQISKFLISPSELKICEEDYERRFEMINRQKTKYPERVKLLEDNIQIIVSDPGNSFDSAEAVRLRNQIEYAYFAYGFSPKEYVYFHLEEKDMRTFVSDIERRCMKFAMNDFTQYVFADKAKAYEYFRKWYNRDAVAVETKNDFSADAIIKVDTRG